MGRVFEMIKIKRIRVELISHRKILIVDLEEYHESTEFKIKLCGCLRT